MAVVRLRCYSPEAELWAFGGDAVAWFAARGYAVTERRQLHGSHPSEPWKPGFHAVLDPGPSPIGQVLLIPDLNDACGIGNWTWA